MQINFFNNITKKYDYFSINKGKLLAKAVKNANKNYNFFYNSEYWSNLALNLLLEQNITTKYVPVRDLLESLTNGNLKLAIGLYLGSNGSGMKTRTNELVEELINTAGGNNVKISILEEVTQLLSIIPFFATIKHLKYNGYEGIVMKEFLLDEVLDKVSLTNTFNSSFVAKALDLIVYANLDIQEEVQKILPYVKKLIPNYHNKVIFDYNRSSSGTKKLKDLQEKFPVDILLDLKGSISIVKTVGFSKNHFIKDLSEQEIDYGYSSTQDYKQTLSISQMVNKFYNTISGSFKKNKNQKINTDEKWQTSSLDSSWFLTSQIQTQKLINDALKNTLDSTDVKGDTTLTNTNYNNLKINISNQESYIPYKWTKKKKASHKSKQVACDNLVTTGFNKTTQFIKNEDYGDTLTLEEDFKTTTEKDSGVQRSNLTSTTFSNSNKYGYNTTLIDQDVLGNTQDITDEL